MQQFNKFFQKFVNFLKLKNHKMTNYKKKIFFCSIIIILFNLMYYLNESRLKTSKRMEGKENGSNAVKDFERYDCKDKRRIGGMPKFVKATNDSMWRIDGAWYICFDKLFATKKYDCNVLSFGIAGDDYFDFEMNEKYKCNVYSFDPYIESERITVIRNSNRYLKNSKILKIKRNWIFYKIGIIGSIEKIKKNEIEQMATLNQILELTQLNNKIVDIFKIDIEGGEFDILESLDIDYACKYFKQFVMETHPNSTNFIYVLKSHFYHNILKKLDQCFLLFHRDTRFFDYKIDTTETNTGLINEYQQKNFSLNIKNFGENLDLVLYILTYGELYFVNKNFIFEV